LEVLIQRFCMYISASISQWRATHTVIDALVHLNLLLVAIQNILQCISHFRYNAIAQSLQSSKFLRLLYQSVEGADLEFGDTERRHIAV
jgi:hypothetical protein